MSNTDTYLVGLLSEKGNAEERAPPSVFEAGNRNTNLTQKGAHLQVGVMTKMTRIQYTVKQWPIFLLWIELQKCISFITWSASSVTNMSVGLPTKNALGKSGNCFKKLSSLSAVENNIKTSWNQEEKVTYSWTTEVNNYKCWKASHLSYKRTWISREEETSLAEPN